MKADPSLYMQPSAALQVILVLQERNPGKLLQSLASTMRQNQAEFHHAVFTPPDSVYGKLKSSEGNAKDLSWQQTLRQAWMAQSPQQAQVNSSRAQLLVLTLPLHNAHRQASHQIC